MPIPAALIGGAVFLLFLIVLDAHVGIALAAGVGGFVAGLLLFPRKKEEDGLAPLSLTGIDREMYEEALTEGRGKLEEMRKLSGRIDRPEIRRKVEQITEIVFKIFVDLRQDPQDIRPARQFLSYYLDATLKILTRYVELSAHGAASADVRASLTRVENSLEMIRKAFERQLAKLLENDVMDLDAELALLENTIKAEGLGGTEADEG